MNVLLVYSGVCILLWRGRQWLSRDNQLFSLPNIARRERWGEGRGKLGACKVGWQWRGGGREGEGNELRDRVEFFQSLWVPELLRQDLVETWGGRPCYGLRVHYRLASQTYAADTSILLAPKRGEGETYVWYIWTGFCVRCRHVGSINQIAVSGNQHKQHLNIKCSKCTLVVFTIEAARAWQSFLHGHVFYWRGYTDGNIQGH